MAVELREVRGWGLGLCKVDLSLGSHIWQHRECLVYCLMLISLPYFQPRYQPYYQSLWPQLAHVLLEGVRAEVRRSGGGGLAARLAVAALQVDNQLVTSAHPVVLAAAQQVRPPAAR